MSSATQIASISNFIKSDSKLSSNNENNLLQTYSTSRLELDPTLKSSYLYPSSLSLDISDTTTNLTPNGNYAYHNSSNISPSFSTSFDHQNISSPSTSHLDPTMSALHQQPRLPPLSKTLHNMATEILKGDSCGSSDTSSSPSESFGSSSMDLIPPIHNGYYQNMLYNMANTYLNPDSTSNTSTNPMSHMNDSNLIMSSKSQPSGGNVLLSNGGNSLSSPFLTNGIGVTRPSSASSFSERLFISFDQPSHTLNSPLNVTPPFTSTNFKPNKNYSFVALPGVNTKKRPRRRYDEIERLYNCNWPGCTKSYGTLNHLNAHVSMQEHGPKRHPDEFKELRMARKKKKQEEVASEFSS